MNTFQQYIGKQISRVMIVEGKKDSPSMGECVAIVLVLEEKGGIDIFFDSSRKITRLEYTTLEGINDWESEEGPTFLIVPESSHRLSGLVGQTLQSIEFWQADMDTAAGDSFVIRDAKYAGVLIKTQNEKVVMYSAINGGQILFDTDQLPGVHQGWILR